MHQRVGENLYENDLESVTFFKQYFSSAVTKKPLKENQTETIDSKRAQDLFLCWYNITLMTHLYFMRQKKCV